MSPIAPLLTALLLLPSQGPLTDGALRGLVGAEFDFAEAALRANTRDAFLAVLHERGVVFQPGPVPAREAYRAQSPDASRLSWYPARAQVSGAGDLGWTLGPWTYSDKEGAPAQAQGWFFSLWVREGAQPWRLMADMGSGATLPHPLPPPLPRPPRGEPLPAPQDAATAGSPIPAPPSDPETAFAERASRQGPSAAYAALLHPQGCLFRNGQAPGGPEALPRLLGDGPGEGHRYETLGRITSRSGDLMGAYGMHHQGGHRAAYLRVWRRTLAQGPWQLLVEAEKPLPR